jgi:hypothetical protein
LAVTPKTDEAFLREVDEELRREQVVDVWKNYGRWIIAAVIGGLAIFAGVLGWNYWSHSKAEAQSVKLQGIYDSLTAGKSAEAQAPLADLAATGAPGARSIAKLLQANQLVEAGKVKEGAALFGDIANDGSLTQPVRDLALIRQTFVTFDTLASQTVIDRMKPLATKESAWLGSAGELVALAYLRLNKPAEARAMFKLIAESENVPDTIRQRAVQGEDAVDSGTTDQKGK